MRGVRAVVAGVPVPAEALSVVSPELRQREVMRASAKCRSCGADIMWVVTTGRGRMPLDAEPAADGNVWIITDGPRSGLARALNAREVEQARADGEPLWMPHHATCPGRARHAVPRAQMTLGDA